MAAEQIFHDSQELKNRVQIGVEQSELSTLQEAMIPADRMESMFSSSYSSFGLRGSYNERNAAEAPVPVQIGQIN